MKARTPLIITFKIPWLVVEIVYVLLVIGLMVLFTIYSGNKFIHLHNFRQGMENTWLLPGWSVPGLVWLLPLICLLEAGLLAYGFWDPRWQRVALWIYVGLMGLFTLFTFILLLDPDRIPCECLGLNANWSWTKQFWVNTGILLLTSLAVWLYYKRIVATIGNENSEHPRKK